MTTTIEKNGKNGKNGKDALPIRERLKALGRDGKVTLEDLTEVSILAMFLVQKLGKATLDDIVAKAQEIYADINPNVLEQSLEALRARGLLSYASGRRKDSQHVKMWKTRKVIWSAPPEVAHVADLLPALVDTKEGHELIDALNSSEKDAGKKKSKRGPDIDDYVDIEVTFMTLDVLIGSQPESPWLNKLISPEHRKIEAGLRFQRNEITGALEIGSDVVRGWLRTALRTRDCGAASASHIAVSAPPLTPKKLVQVTLPIIDMQTKRGLGLATHEGIEAGEKFSLIFRIPTRGFMEPDAFVAWLAIYAPNPIRGMSPARGGRFGKLAVVDHKILGRICDAEQALKNTAANLPPEAQEYYAKLMAKMKGVDLRAVSKGGGEFESDEDGDDENSDTDDN